MKSDNKYVINKLKDIVLKDKTGRKTIASILLSGFVGTSKQLTDESGISYGACRHIIRGLKSEGLVYIFEWAPPEGKRAFYCPMYAMGHHDDAPKPKVVKAPPKPKRPPVAKKKTQEEILLEKKRAIAKEVHDALHANLNAVHALESNLRYWHWISRGQYGSL